MSAFFEEPIGQYAKVGLGALLIAIGVALPFLIEPAETIRMAALETEGVRDTATITSLQMSPQQTPRRVSTLGSYLSLRGLGASRKLALGGTLLARSAARSDARAQANGPAYYDVEYRIPVANGQYIIADERLLLARTSTLKVGSELAILHDKIDPGIHRLVNYSKPTHRVDPAVKYVPGVLSAMFGLFLIWWGVSRSDAAATQRPGGAARQPRTFAPAAPVRQRTIANIPAGRLDFANRARL